MVSGVQDSGEEHRRSATKKEAVAAQGEHAAPRELCAAGLQFQFVAAREG